MMCLACVCTLSSRDLQSLSNACKTDERGLEWISRVSHGVTVVGHVCRVFKKAFDGFCIE